MSLVIDTSFRSAAVGVAVRENHAYLTAGSDDLIILDISDPANPVRTGSISLGSPGRGIALAEKYAYVAADNAGLKVIDIANSTAPSLIGTCNTPGSARAVVIVGKFAYIADYDTGLQIVDLADPVTPVLVGAYDTSGFAVALTVVGDTVYLADTQQGLQIIDVSKPSLPKKISEYRTTGNILSVAVSGNTAFVAAAAEGLQILDIKDRANPIHMGTYRPQGEAVAVATVGNRLLLTCTSGLQIVDISSKTNPAALDGYQISGLTSSAVTSFVRMAPATAQDIIFDCDPGNDVDDMGDLAVMHALADQGELNILAVMYSLRPGFGAPNIEIANRFYGRPDLPIGVSKTSYFDSYDWYGSFLQTNFYHSIGHSSNAPNAITLYREILASRPDKSVTIVTAGQLRNIDDLWKSASDASSPLAGPDLLARKLKRLVIVAGVFPTGREYNMFVDPVPAGVINVITNSVPVTFVGIELGNNVLIGSTILSKPETDPIRAAYDTFYKGWNVDRRPAWAGLGLMFAARGYGTEALPLFTATKGYGNVSVSDGSNYWRDDPTANQEYLSLAQPVAHYSSVLDELLMRPPMSEGTIYSVVADQNAGLHVINITDPAHLIRAGGYESPGKPRLEVFRNGPSLTVRWPDQHVGYSVQSAAALEGAWVTLSSGIETTNGYYSFTENNPATSRFYRLEKR